MDKWYAHLETGFAAGNMLLQGSALGVGCWFGTELGGDERVGIREMIWAEVDDVPVVVVSVGMFEP